jgi:mono/diheme cytochrome c family protein
MRRMIWRTIWIAAFALGCSPGGAPALSEAATRGHAVYTQICVACHNPDPALEGSLGPAIAGSSRALLEARVLRAEYPPGHVPKRDSKAMPPFPQLADKIDDLAAYLAECCPAK